MGWNKATDDHPVVRRVMTEVGNGAKGGGGDSSQHAITSVEAEATPAGTRYIIEYRASDDDASIPFLNGLLSDPRQVQLGVRYRF